MKSSTTLLGLHRLVLRLVHLTMMNRKTTASIEFLSHHSQFSISHVAWKRQATVMRWYSMFHFVAWLPSAQRLLVGWSRRGGCFHRRHVAGCSLRPHETAEGVFGQCYHAFGHVDSGDESGQHLAVVAGASILLGLHQYILPQIAFRTTVG